MAESQNQSKLGRKPSLNPDDQTLSTLEGLAKIQCTTKEAASVLGVSEPTLFAFFKRHQKARDIWDDGKESGRASLRRRMFKSAMDGNVTAQIWLSKQHLGMSDKVEERVEMNAKVETVDRSELTEKARQLQAQVWEAARAGRPAKSST